MTDAWGSLHIDVVDDEIIVTLPFTIYTVTYYKPPNSPQLLAKNFPSKDDPRVPLTQAEFLARAWRVATDKARELGWIEGKIPEPVALPLRGNLRIEVRDDEIVVTLPGTSYRAVYHKPADRPGLIAAFRSGRWEQGTSIPEVNELLADIVARVDEIFAEAAVHFPAPTLAAAWALHIRVLHRLVVGGLLFLIEG
jgi:hypothetical protein